MKSWKPGERVIFTRGGWSVTVEQTGAITMHARGSSEEHTVLEVSAFDLRRALGEALDAIQRAHGHTLAELEASLRKDIP
jgi:hypothetical protein